MHRPPRLLPGLLVAAGTLACLLWLPARASPARLTRPEHGAARADRSSAAFLPTRTRIKHLVVIFPENKSFDNYFGAYPHALNRDGEPPFHALPRTPRVDGLSRRLRQHNPNLHLPARLGPLQSFVCKMTAKYAAEQKAYDGARADRFVQIIEPSGHKSYREGETCPDGIVMDYFDGNTVTALWNYAQHYVLSDRNFGTVFGESTPGALNLIGSNGGVLCGPVKTVYPAMPTCTAASPPAPPQEQHVLYADADPYYDSCSSGPQDQLAALSGENVGTLLNREGITWGWFEGGFDDCTATHPLAAYNRAGGRTGATTPLRTPDYVPHHEPFQYFASTANPLHLRPGSVGAIGHTDRARHQYDLTDFWRAVAAGSMPAVSFLKPPGYQDGHPGRSDSLDEQEFLVTTINHLQRTAAWKSTAIIIEYDDSGGWYDHVRAAVVNHSATDLDFRCGGGGTGVQGRCGYGPRLPFLLISPYARRNYVDHTVIDQTSVRRFIEDNWLQGERLPNTPFDRLAHSINGMFNFSHPRRDRLILDPLTGEVVSTH